jgi:hypothetical protein
MNADEQAAAEEFDPALSDSNPAVAEATDPAAASDAFAPSSEIEGVDGIDHMDVPPGPAALSSGESDGSDAAKIEPQGRNDEVLDSH